MLLNHFKAVAIATVSLLMLSGTNSRAESIAIVNPSFELALDNSAASYDLPNGAYVLFAGGVGNIAGGTVPPAGITIVGWTSTGTGDGIYDVAPSVFAVSNVTGENIAFLNPVEIIKQDLTGSTLQVGTYVLAADVGSASATANNDLPVLTLNAGGVEPVTSVSAGVQGTGALLPVTSTYTILAGNASLGQPLSILLSRTGPGIANGMYFDNLSLTFIPVPVPEPSSCALLATCVPALAMIRRRKKQAMR